MTQPEQQHDVGDAKREAWVKPDVARIRAGEAELGANPVIAEGFFGKGS